MDTPRKIGWGEWGCEACFPKSLPCLWPKSAYSIYGLFKTSLRTSSNISQFSTMFNYHYKHNLWRALLMVLLIMMKKWPLLIYTIQFKTSWVQSHTLFMTKTTNFDTLLITKTAENHSFWGCTCPSGPYKAVLVPQVWYTFPTSQFLVKIKVYDH